MLFGVMLSASSPVSKDQNTFTAPKLELLACGSPYGMYLSGALDPASYECYYPNTEYVVRVIGGEGNISCCIRPKSSYSIIGSGCSDASPGVDLAVGKILSGSGNFMAVTVDCKCSDGGTAIESVAFKVAGYSTCAEY